MMFENNYGLLLVLIDITIDLAGQLNKEYADAKLARHQEMAANNCKKSAALDGPASAAPIVQQKLATN